MKFKALILFIIFSLFLISCESKDKWINPYDSKADQSETAKVCEKNQIECGTADIDYQGITFEIDCGKCSDGYECRFNNCWDINECEDPALNDCPQHSDCHNLDMESDGQPYECICKENYSGNNCVPDSRKKDCTGLPANAEWNSVSNINQTWNGTEWQPSNSGTFNEASSSAECRYKCKPNYTWTGSACKADTKTANCTGLPENAEWNTASSIEQTWNGEEWAPSSKGTYNESKSSKECRFNCKNNFEWNGSKCVGAKQTVSCSGLPENAVWNTASEIEQTWDGTKWLPTEKGTYNEEASESECRFKCNKHYDWNGSKCVAATQIYTCTGKPKNSVWNTVSEYTQTWDGSNWIPAASNATYNTNASTTECRFKCDTNYNWNDSTKKCDAATQQAGCSAKPANSIWNDGGANGMFMQTWNGSAWIPASYDSSYSTTAGICTFTCDTNYNWNNSNKTCDAAKQEADCSPKPANSVWNNSGTEGRFIQTWTDSGWTPASYTSTYSATSGICTFTCESDYHWENNQCGSNSRTDVACTGKPTNASWNTAARIDQTWNGSSWQPSSTAQYNEEASETECRFKCDEHYDWNSSNKTCDTATQKEDCSAKPEHTVWNDNGENGKFTQTWNNGAWDPASYESIYSETAGICTFKCDDTHYWYNSECTSPCDHDPCEEVANSTHVCEATSWNDYICECDDGYFWNGSECKKQITLGNICTGQTKCYNNTEEITCPTLSTADFYGQDAQYAKAGYCYPQSFTVKTVSGKNIVVDNNTGLEWQQVISEDSFIWKDALSHCENLEYGGYSDWRLPTPQELLTIVDNSKYALTIDSTYFPNMKNTFWTGQENSGDTSRGFYFSAYYGGVWRDKLKTETSNVICVRGNELAQSTFTTKTINGNEIVTDSTNNLMWQKNYSNSTYTWINALKYCENLTHAGYNDWRLPNRNEAISLFDFEKSNAPYSEFPDMPNSGFWSSSNYSGNNSAAWSILFYDGQFAYTYSKSKSFKVRCVRSEKINDPCKNNNNCAGVNHSTGVCVPDNAFEYSCECIEGHFWDGENCVDPCSTNPCSDVANSNKTCTALSWQNYSCGCDSGYSWNSSTLTCDELTQQADCSAKPANSVWNDNGANGKFTQTWSGSAWTPASYTSSYNTTAGTCRFECNSGYEWNGSECKKRVSLGKICTGQTTCYNNSSSITCPTSASADFYGQDAQYRSKCTAQSFTVKTVSNQKVVVDNNTLLEWQQTLSTSTYTWDKAVSYCNNLSYAGYSDWRLPSPQEFLSIVSNSKTGAAVDSTYFPNMPTSNDSDSYMWTSKEQTSTTAFDFRPYYGFVYYNNSKTGNRRVMCVRGSELPQGSFTSATTSGKVVVTDSTTGLMWQKETVSGKTWQQALKYCETSTYAGYSDWRLPNKNELSSLLNYDITSKPYSDFPSLPSSWFWASSTLQNSGSKAWYVGFENGYHGLNGTKSRETYVLCVRN